MQYHNEAQIMKVLDIESWRHLSKDKVFQFLAMVPEMDRDVALRVIGQFPEFTKLAIAALEDKAKAYESTLSSNERSQATVHAIELERLAMLQAELTRDLAPDEHLWVFEEVRDVHEKAIARDAENKKFLTGLYLPSVLGAIVVVVAALVYVGARIGVQAGGDREGSLTV
jgi:hypothetical protein